MTPSLGFVIAIIAYIYTAYCLYIIAKKTGTANEWLAWIPICNIYLLIKITKKPTWWLLLFFIPVINFIILIILWMEVAKVRNRSKWLGILAMIPLINFFIYGILAFTDRDYSGYIREEDKRLKISKEPKKSKIKWVVIGLILINWIIIELVNSSYAEAPIVAIIFLGILGISSVLIPLGLILFFLKFPKSKTKTIISIVLLPIVLRAFLGTLAGHFITSFSLRGMIDVHAKFVTEQVLNTKDRDRCFQIGQNPILRFLYWFTYNSISVSDILDYGTLKQAVCITDLAVAEKDDSLCVSSQDAEKFLIFSISGTKMVPTEDCSTKVAIAELQKPFLQECLESKNRDICIRNYAIEKKDEELCKYIVGFYGEWQKSCELDIRILTDEVLTSCRSFITHTLPYPSAGEIVWQDEQSTEKNKCVEAIAIGSSSVELCNLLPSGLERVDCIIEIAKNINNIEICGELEGSESLQDFCRREAVIPN